jgi:hypothetical protein
MTTVEQKRTYLIQFRGMKQELQNIIDYFIKSDDTYNATRSFKVYMGFVNGHTDMQTAIEYIHKYSYTTTHQELADMFRSTLSIPEWIRCRPQQEWHNKDRKLILGSVY